MSSTPWPPEPVRSVDEILELYETWGPHRYDEVVTQLDHALQTAAHARAAKAEDALVVAALLHDVGHLLELRSGRPTPDGTVDAGHEAVGARWLATLLPPPVTAPIALHVAAKRYRAAADPGYRASLSAGSVASLARQGGPMSPTEAERFTTHPAHRDALHLRSWDDAGKVVDGVDVPGLDAYAPIVSRLAHAR